MNNFQETVEAVEKLISLTREINDISCICDIMYGYQCNHYQREQDINKAEFELMSLIRQHVE
mgnify:FL=1